MDVRGDHTFAHPREAVFATLIDIGTLPRTLPGFQEMVELGPGHHRVTLKVSVVVSTVTVSGEIKTVEEVAPERYRVQVSGSGSAGSLSVDARFALAENGPAATLVRYDLRVETTGALSALGSQILEPIAKMIMAQYMGSVEKEIGGRVKAAR
jgi:carbon monoxide dehydrogenase subunit G